MALDKQSDFCYGVGMDYLRLTQDDLSIRLAHHEKWLRGETGGLCLKLMGMKLANLDFSNHDLSYAHLSGSELTGGNFQNCKMVNAVLVGCNLQSADFTNTNLMGSSLAFADCRDALFLNVNLQDTFLREVIGLRQTYSPSQEINIAPKTPRIINQGRPTKRRKKKKNLLTKLMNSVNLF